MNKVLLGIISGVVLGALDGSTAWLAPEARAKMIPIMIGATMKGIVVGLIVGFFARRVRSLPLGVLFGLGVDFILAFLVAFHEHSHYLNIVLAGTIQGGLLGYITQRWGFQGAASAPH
jgi:predicted cation transporter